MKRLTERYTNKGMTGVCLKALDNKGNTADTSLVFERLAEFEDFMEDKGFESLEELKNAVSNIERLKVYEDYKFEVLYPKVKILGKTHEDIQELLDKWLKLGSEDKISFAIEQLEKVKEFLAKRKEDYWYLENEMKAISYSEYIGFVHEVETFELNVDSQIKQLKEMKQDGKFTL